MVVDTTDRRSRRAILISAAAGAAAIATARLGSPDGAAAADPNDLVLNKVNATTAKTGINQSTANLTGFSAQTAGKGSAIEATSPGGAGIVGTTGDSWLVGAAGLQQPTTGSAWDSVHASPTGTIDSGLYGWGNRTTESSGVFGESRKGIGVVGYGNIGAVFMSDTYIGVSGRSTVDAGVHGHGGAFAVPAAAAKTGVLATASADGVALAVRGTATFSGKATFSGAGASDVGASVSTTSATKPAVLGASDGANTGVQGFSGAHGTQPAAPAKTGVYGYAAQDAAARGVTGQSTLGYGVSGIATTGHGVNGAATTGIGAIGYATTGTGAYGYATTGVGARGYAASGTALYASTSGPKVGTALQTVGKVRFDKSVGVATIAAAHNSVTVTPGIDLTATSAVVATLMGSAGGLTTVHRVVVNATTDTFTIYLTANATAAVTVAWHVFG